MQVQSSSLPRQAGSDPQEVRHARGKRLPVYGRHSSGQARVRIGGQEIYLGKFGTAESRDAYQQVVATYVATGKVISPLRVEKAVESGGPTVNDVLLEYTTRELAQRSRDLQKRTKRALRPLRLLYGETPANAFGPRALATVREEFERTGKLCRKEVNSRVQMIKRAFKWAVSRELVHASVAHGLAALEGLRRGETEAHESREVGPVAWVHVEAVLPHVNRQVRAMILLQRHSGARPGEVCAMRSAEIDRSQTPWVYDLRSHKTSRFGKRRRIPLGPKARPVLAPFLLGRPPERELFSPAEAEAERAATRGRSRRTSVQPSQQERARLRRARPRRGLKACYNVPAYRHAIERGILAANALTKRDEIRAWLHTELPPKRHVKIDDAVDRLPVRISDRTRARLLRRACGRGADKELLERLDKALATMLKEPGPIPHWHPNQIRHSTATELERESGDIDAVRTLLGHSSLDVTRIYVERDFKRAAELAERLG